MQRRWHTITLQPEGSDQRARLEGWLVQQGVPGWEDHEHGLRFYLSPEEVQQGRLTALREESPPGVGWSEGDIDEEDWAEGWKQYFKPTLLTPRLAVCPTWETWDPPAGVQVITMDPGMAFGTGGHATTRLCLELMERYLSAAGTILDVGTGSGILAIGGLLLGAQHAVLTDSDPLCVEVCGENLERNALADQAEVLAGMSFEPVGERQFDLIVANLVTVILLDIAPQIASHLAPGGVFVGSGTTVDKVSTVMQALQAHGLTVLECRTEGDWAAVAAELVSPQAEDG